MMGSSGSTGPDGHTATPSFSQDVAGLVELGEVALGLLRGIAELAGMEARLAASSLPKLLAVLILTLPLALLSWVALSCLISWLVFLASHSATLGILAFLLIQVGMLFVCKLLLGRYRRNLSMPHTRYQIRNLSKGLYDGVEGRNQSV